MIVERKLSMLLRQLFSGSVVVGLSLMTHSVMAQEVTQSTTDTSAPAQVQKNKVAETKADPSMQRVEITGSSIKRVAAQGALPVTVLKTEDLARAGATTAQEALSTISAMQAQFTTASNVGTSKTAGSAADLRSLGSSHTLVLLNGRRLAPSAFDGSAVDLNIIPIAALDRVEVLRDGASAIYGTDAIGGVINFITKRSYTGLNISAEGVVPQQTGGQQGRVNVSGGLGDLDADGYNFFGVFDYHKQSSVDAKDRDISRQGMWNPGLGMFGGSGFAGPIANYYDIKADKSGNPAFANGCNPPLSNPKGGTCRFNSQSTIGIVPKTSEWAFLGKGTFKLNQDNNAFVEYLHSESKVTTYVAADPMVGDGSGNPATDYVIFPTSPYYHLAGPTSGGPLSLNWRAVDGGRRVSESDNSTDRIVLGLEGTQFGWDYKTGLTYAMSKASDSLNGGYFNNSMIMNGFSSGVLNPFGDQSAAGSALLNSASLHGEYEKAKTQETTLDFTASRAIATLPAGDLGFAIGGEVRNEKADFTVNHALADLDASTGSVGANDSSGSRNVAAIFSELNVPIVKGLEAQLAARYDHYSDAGGTFNPKIAMRWQPAEQLMFRSSYSTGFRAPSLYELNDPNTKTFTNATYNDPVLCPGGTPAAGGNSNRDCGQQFYKLIGGNKDLQPEKSKSFTLGMVIEPARNLTMSVDYFNIRIKNQISALDEGSIFDDPAKYGNLFVRKPDGSLSYIVDTNANLGNVKTQGFDLGLAYRLPKTDYGNFGFSIDGTYVTQYDYQKENGGQYFNNLAVYGGGVGAAGGVVFRWKHTATLNWSQGPWSALLQQSFMTGYLDQNGSGVDPAHKDHHVGSYTLYNASATYSGIKNTTVTLGIKNIFNTEPPASNVTDNFQYGYDARYSDPIGRAFFVRANYKFF